MPLHRTTSSALLRTVVAGLGAILALAACGEPTTGADQTVITFTTDVVSCSAEVAIEITIDGESQGSFGFAPGTSWSFPVDPGTHSVQATGELAGGGFIAVDRQVTVGDSDEFVVLITCSS